MTAIAAQLRSSDAPGAGLSRAAKLGLAGMALAVLAFFVCVPPFHLRTPIPSFVACAVAMGMGVGALREGERRAGFGAVAFGLLCGVGAWAATQSGLGNLEQVVSWGALTAAMLRYATPLIFAGLGGLVSERSGVVNIGLEGMMLMGAFFGAYGADKTGSWVGGLVIGMIAGGVLALIHAVFSVSLRADQIVSGTALNFVAMGVTGYLYNDIYGDQGTPDNLPAVPDINLPIKSVGFFGDAFGQLNLMIWVAAITLVAVWFVVFRTPGGLRLRSVGENPKAAETVGIDVIRTRYLAVIASGALAAAGGAYLSIGFVHSFTASMIAGRGFIALAALITGRWRPFGVLWATLLFGFCSALAQRLPAFSPSAATLFQALPYVVTLIVVAGVVGRSVPPAADGVPYKRDR